MFNFNLTTTFRRILAFILPGRLVLLKDHIWLPHLLEYKMKSTADETDDDDDDIWNLNIFDLHRSYKIPQIPPLI
ncbi:hypothetical protein C8R44DRAFT_976677 [Mycena epipterygia]|nr:hypothetical protein C8R44DRAFT_976677 [Mycena epipterygia]